MFAGFAGGTRSVSAPRGGKRSVSAPRGGKRSGTARRTYKHWIPK